MPILVGALSNSSDSLMTEQFLPDIDPPKSITIIPGYFCQKGHAQPLWSDKDRKTE